ncbi:non-specific lipid-transfer protein-like protein [Hibiscus syriacus]|uniref:Non-specific lipid-transfer protein-like protein n=1 Tax=Hibiscus syriacus TaxID=106335 RepID=A0A6A3CX72_HIBSY|nr:non-specific lipid-transfer protein-like protein [Hibiscus syriacus]
MVVRVALRDGNRGGHRICGWILPEMGTDVAIENSVSTGIAEMGNNGKLEAETYVVVTGANKGIGFEIARQLASKDVTVVLTARDEVRGNEATAKLHRLGFSDPIFHQLDVNNAGVSGAIVDEDSLKALALQGGGKGDSECGKVYL